MTEHSFTRSKPYSSKAGCPAGYHKRGGYRSLTGQYVPPRCVRATTKYKESTKQFRARIAKKQTQRLMRIPTIKTLTRKNCPPGKIARKSYVRRYSTKVRQAGYTVHRKSGKTYRVVPKAKSMMVQSKCVKDLGLPGKGPSKGQGFAPLRKGELAKHGYSFRKTNSQRYAALNSAVKDYGALGVYRKLDAVAKLTLRTVPTAASVFKKDRNWVQQRYGPLKAF